MLTLLTTVIMLLTFMTFNGCKKDVFDPLPKDQPVSIGYTQIEPDLGGLKSTFPCKSNIPDHAKVTIGGITYYPKLFTNNGVLYTESIKFPVGDYTISEFVLYDDIDGIDGLNTDVDIIVFGTPTAGAEYEGYISSTSRLPKTFHVTGFTKVDLKLEVLCFEDKAYQAFGFDWFSITEIVVREQCFFGDIFFKNYNDYASSHYALQPDGLKMDMPAIFRIDVFKNGQALQSPYFSFTNDITPNYGVGSPVCVTYPDNISITGNGEVFTFRLYVLVKIGDNFCFKEFYSWAITDNEQFVTGPDGIVDFVIGNGNMDEPDVQLAPYMNLPETATVNFIFDNFFTCSGYWKLNTSNFYPSASSTGYDISTGQMSGFCGDKDVYLTPNTYTVNIYSSLTNVGWPTMPAHLTLQAFAKANWLFNNLSEYGIDINNISQNDGRTIQMALWQILGNNGYNVLVGGDEAKSIHMATDAISHGNFVPFPGGWAAVLMMVNNNPLLYQLIFTIIDP